MYYVLNTDERYKLDDLLQRFAVIIRIANCKEYINDLDELNNFCLETYIKVLELFPWLEIPETVHKLLAHLAQVIAANGGRGLGNLSEVFIKVYFK